MPGDRPTHRPIRPTFHHTTFALVVLRLSPTSLSQRRVAEPFHSRVATITSPNLPSTRAPATRSTLQPVIAAPADLRGISGRPPDRVVHLDVGHRRARVQELGGPTGQAGRGFGGDCVQLIGRAQTSATAETDQPGLPPHPVNIRPIPRCRSPAMSAIESALPAVQRRYLQPGVARPAGRPSDDDQPA